MTNPTETTRILSRAEDEIMHGVRPPSDRGGRLPIFYREEVDAIRQDRRTVSTIAQDWGVAIDTIRRIKRHGCFRDYEYIPRDEVNRALAYRSSAGYPSGNPTPEQAIAELEAQRVRRPRGRPLSRNRILTPMEHAEILADKRPARVIGKEYGLDTMYVYKLKWEYRDAQKDA